MGRGVPSPPGEGYEDGMCPSPENVSIFLAQKGEFWYILGVIKPTFDRPGVSIFF